MSLKDNIKNSQKELQKTLIALGKEIQIADNELTNSTTGIITLSKDQQKELQRKIIARGNSISSVDRNMGHLGKMETIIAAITPTAPGTTIPSTTLADEKTKAKTIKDEIMLEYKTLLEQLDDALDPTKILAFASWDVWANAFHATKTQCGSTSSPKTCYEILKLVNIDPDFQTLAIATNPKIESLKKKLGDMKLTLAGGSNQLTHHQLHKKKDLIYW